MRPPLWRGAGALHRTIEQMPEVFRRDAVPERGLVITLADGEQLEFFKSLDMLESLNRLEEKDDGQVKPKPTQQGSSYPNAISYRRWLCLHWLEPHWCAHRRAHIAF